MEKLSYTYDGEIYNLSFEERQQFDCGNQRDCVDKGSNTVFNLKNGEIIMGVVDEITHLDPLDNSDNRIQGLFRIKTDNSVIELKFFEIESHSPAPYKKTPLF